MERERGEGEGEGKEREEGGREDGMERKREREEEDGKERGERENGCVILHTVDRDNTHYLTSTFFFSDCRAMSVSDLAFRRLPKLSMDLLLLNWWSR